MQWSSNPGERPPCQSLGGNVEHSIHMVVPPPLIHIPNLSRTPPADSVASYASFHRLSCVHHTFALLIMLITAFARVAVSFHFRCPRRNATNDVSVDHNALPFERIVAEVSHDMWSLGVVIFQLLGGAALFQVSNRSFPRVPCDHVRLITRVRLSRCTGESRR